MKNKAAKQKSKRKGSENAFGCDLSDHLHNSGHDVPQVLKTCAEFIEEHGVVDGIYRLSGITSNIQRLRQEFNSEQCPDLTKEVYLQDIHCVGSLCKLYFRELPNPLLTYELYQKFTDAVSVPEEHEQLRNIQCAIKELPITHFRTLEYLAKHLAHLATLSHQTNMHTRNLALVWAPNLLRSKEIEVSACNGDEAFLEVRVQQSVVEFILNHTEQIFNPGADPPKPLKAGAAVMCVEKYATLPAVSQCPPMKLMSLEEAQARSLAPNHPARTERLRENSLPDTSTAAMYHTVIELSESKRKFSGKSKKWKSIFSLGRSAADGKGKLSRNGSVFMRAQNVSEKTGIRPSKSMDSLCSLPTDDGKPSPGRKNGFFAPVVKSRTLGSDINYDPNEEDPNWEFELRKASGETAGNHANPGQNASSSSSSSPPPSSSSTGSSPLQRALPEQLKVFKGDETATCRPTSPKSRRMLHNGSSRPSFPGSLFPLESSPRHQRKALNISEPFAVSVPLRVSAVISSNSTPCRVAGKERERGMGSLGSASFREPHPSNSGSFDFRDRERLFGGRENPLGNSAGYGIYSNSSSVPTDESQMNERSTGVVPSETAALSSESVELKPRVEMSQNSVPSQSKATEKHKEMPRSSGKELDASSVQLAEPKKLDQLDVISPEPWPDHELRITEPDTNVSKDQLKTSGSMSKITGHDGALNLTARAKRRSSLPTHPVSFKEHFKDVIKGFTVDHSGARRFNRTSSLSPETHLEHEDDWNYGDAGKKDCKSLDSFETLDVVRNELQLTPFLQLRETDILQDADPCLSGSSPEDPSAKEKNDTNGAYGSNPDNKSCGKGPGLSADELVDLLKNRNDDNTGDEKKTHRISLHLTTKVKRNIERLSRCLDERRLTVELPGQDEDDIWGSHLAGLDQVEPWEDLTTTKQWVTSPLHSTKLEDIFLLFNPPAPASGAEIKTSSELSISHSQKGETTVEKEPTSGKVPENTACEPGLNLTSKVKKADESGSENITELVLGDKDEEKVEMKHDLPQPSQTKTTSQQEETTRIPKRNNGTPKPKTSVFSQKFHRQVSHEPCIAERNEENVTPKHRPYSLNLDLGNRCIRDISNQQNLDLTDHFSFQRGAITPSGTTSLELEMFLRDRQAPMRRNSAPVSVSSVRTAFMIKTCQAKAVPVVPPKVQYSHVPHPVHPEKAGQEQDKRENGPEKIKVEKADSLPPLTAVKDYKEERENCKPVSRIQRTASVEKTPEMFKAAPVPEFPVLRRKRSANGDSFMDCPSRPERSTLLQRSSFRNRPRPQSLILFSPPFPIMDYHPSGDDGKHVLSPIKSPTAETSPLDVFTKELTENLKTPDGVTLRNKMTLPKSGQRLETSTSCFYQPQRRSMIFDSRSSRQIE